MQDTEAAIKTLGQAYIQHRLCKDLQVRLGREQDLFQGLARCQLDTFATEAVLLLAAAPEAGGGAAVVLSGQQEAQLVAALRQLEFSVIPGTLQIMQAIPEGRLPQLTDMLCQLQQGSAAAAQAAGQGSFLKLMCLGVRPDTQGKGVGGELLGAAVAAAQQQKQPLYADADASDSTVVDMLRRQGFKEVGRVRHFAQLAFVPL